MSNNTVLGSLACRSGNPVYLQGRHLYAGCYWLSFAIDEADGPIEGQGARSASLFNRLRAVSNGWWPKSDSLVVFSSPEGIDELVALIRAAIDPSSDTVVLGLPDYRSCRVIGAAMPHEALEAMIPLTARS